MREIQAYDLSHGQKRFWFQSQLDPDDRSFNQSMAIRIRQEVNTDYLEQSLHQVIQRHFILRTVFKNINGEPKQVILKRLTIEVPVIDLSNLNPEIMWTEAIKEMQVKSEKPFDLEFGPLLRANIYRLANKDYVFHICMHHIIEDGWSMDLFFRELLIIYKAIENDVSPRLPELPIQYIDYANWQNQMIAAKKLKKQEDYWKNKLAGDLPSLNLPYDFSRPKIRKGTFAVQKVELESNLCKRLEEMNRNNGTTMFMSMVACLNVLLSKLSNQNDLLVGTPIAGRGNKNVKNLIGFFVNTLVLRNHLPENMTFSDFLKRVKKNCIEAYANQDYPFDQLLQTLNYTREINRAPLFDVLIHFASNYRDEEEFGEMKFEKVNISDGTVPNEFDLTVIIEMLNDKIVISLSYPTDLFTEKTMRRIGENFHHIISSAAHHPDQPVHKMTYLSMEEALVIKQVNATQKTYPHPTTIPALFMQQVARNPSAVSVLDHGYALTYEELHRRSNQIGNLLRHYGVQPNQLVGIMAERGSPLLTAILGILKAGGAYLPIDPEYPESRIEYMLVNSSCRILITDYDHVQRLKDRLPSSIETIIYLESTETEGKTLSVAQLRSGDEDHFEHDLCAHDVEMNFSSSNLAYVMYTSGSTGQPKGVMITHEAMLNTLFWLQDTFRLEPADVVAQKTSASFTDSVWEFFWPLLTGAKLSIISTEDVKDPFKLYASLKEGRVTVTQFVPALMSLFLSAVRQSGDDHPLPDLKWVFNGGEALPLNVVDDWYSLFRTAKIANIYGMTESAIYATSYIIQEKPNQAETFRIPLGQPIANTHVYVLDRTGQIAGFNVPGEICIGGIGMTSGYWNQPELTKRAFTAHPTTGEPLYRTGDLGYLRPDGVFEYLGRQDDQVQIRGFRVEMKEVELAMARDPFIEEAAVVAHTEKSGATALIGYYAGKQEPENAPEQVRSRLKNVLPEYMIPDHLVQMESLPLTAHGKVDRKNLPELDGRNLSVTEYRPPNNVLEKKLVNIWKEVLEVQHIGTLDHFFALGGQSLKMAKMIYRIQEQLDVNVTFQEIFEHQTVLDLAGLIKRKTETFLPVIESTDPALPAIEPVKEQAYYQVSAAQRRLYVLQQLEGDSMSNHISSAWMMEGKVDRYEIESIFKEIILKHEVFRTGFTLIEGNIYQKIYPVREWKMEYEEGTEEGLPSIFTSFVRPFDLQHPPLLRVKMLDLDEQKCALFIDVHHVIFDGISANLLIDEFISIFEKKQSMQEPRIQYKDFAAWQNNLFAGERIKAHENYWMGEFDQHLTGKEIPLLQLPTDFPRKKRKNFDGRSLRFMLTKECSANIQALAKKNGATMFMALLATYNVFLQRYSGQEDIVVGVPVAGRQHAQLERVIGMFVNTLPIRSYPIQNKTFRQFLNEVKEKTMDALQHQDYPFDHLVSRLKLERDLSRNPLFDTMFRFQDMEEEKRVSGLHIEPYPIDTLFVPFDLMLTVLETDHGLQCTFDYSSELFEEETIHQMARHFTELVSSVLSKPDEPLYEANLLTEREHEQLLVTRNATARELPFGKFVHQMFEDQALQTPQATAVECKGRNLSYSELDTQSNRLARTLRDKGAAPNKVIAILLDRSVELLTAMLAVLKAGGAYLPIDPEYPFERMNYMLEESDAHILLTKKGKIKRDDFNGEVINVDCAGAYHENGSPLQTVLHSSDMAYMMFTSGSTGKPKGVKIGQEAVVNFIYGITDKIPFRPGQTLFSVTTAAFDIFLLESLLPLTQGLRVILSTAEEEKDLDLLMDSLHRHKVEIFQTTPSRMQLLLLNAEAKERLEALKIVMIGGEAFPVHLLSHIKKITSARLFNMYGPTETTVWSTVQELTDRNQVTVGKPIANTRVYITDRHLKPVPEQVVGHLWISGKGLSLGYYKRDELTAEKFVRNPFVPGEWMFDTGDLARWQRSGEIEVLGRTDHQLKVRGYRVEPGEIEHQLLKHPEIEEAVVVLSEEQERSFLCAYLVCQSDLTVKEIRQYLSIKLPEYMVPSHFIHLMEIPLTPNGKVNRKELPSLDDHRPNLGVDFIPPQTGVERQISQVWEEVLKREEIGVHDHFFDLGGDSILLIQMNYRINKLFNTRLALADFFSYPTIARLAECIKTRLGEKREWTAAEKKRYHDQKTYWENQLAETLPLVPFLDEMRAVEIKKQQTSFTLTLPAGLIYTLQRVLQNQSFGLVDLLLSVFTYVLSMATNRSELVIAVGEEFNKGLRNTGTENMYPLRIKLEENEEFSQLCKDVFSQRTFAAKTDLYSIPKLPSLAEKEGGDVCLVGLLINQPALAGDVSKQYDWLIYLDVREENVSLLCEYQGAKLRKTWVEQTMRGYARTLNKLADKL